MALVLSALSLVSHFVPFVPDYDGLDYYRVAGNVRDWLLGQGDGTLQIMHAGKWVPYWPISNGPSTYFVALFGELVHKNYAPVVANTAYLLAFVAYVGRLRGWAYTLALVVLLCAQILFFRLFTTLTTEFAVGLWLVALLVTLVDARPRRWPALWMLVVVGLLLRVVDAAFLVSIGGGYVLTQAVFFRRFDAVRLVAGGIVVPALVMAVPLWYHVEVMVNYVNKTATGVSAESWKSLAGVSTRWDLPARYLDYLNLYNNLVPLLFVAALAGCILLRGAARRLGLQAFVLACAAASPLLAAASLNIQVVFWVYAVMVFAIVEWGWLVAGQAVLPSLWRARWAWAGTGVAGVGLAMMLVSAWQRESGYLLQLADYTRMSRAIAQPVALADDVRYVGTNYAGIGPLDAVGLAYAAGRSFSDAGARDIFSRNRDPAAYLAFDDRLNLFVVARENYFFPVHFGINDHVAATSARMAEQGEAFGFRSLGAVADRGRVFDLWYRPGAVAYPEFVAHGDWWIAGALPVVLGTQTLCGDATISGRLQLDLTFPQVTEAPAYGPPFPVRLVDRDGRSVAQATVEGTGLQTVELQVGGVTCGNYRVVFEQQFSTVADPRRLSALYGQLRTVLRFDPARH